MPIQSWGKSGVLAFFGPKISNFGHIFWDMDFKLFCPSFPIILRGQPNWKSIGPSLTILASKKHKNGHISKFYFAQESINKNAKIGQDAIFAPTLNGHNSAIFI